MSKSLSVMRDECTRILATTPSQHTYVVSAATLGIDDSDWPETIDFDGARLDVRSPSDNRRGKRCGYLYEYIGVTYGVALYVIA